MRSNKYFFLLKAPRSKPQPHPNRPARLPLSSVTPKHLVPHSTHPSRPVVSTAKMP